MESEKIRGEAKSLTCRGIELTYCELGAANSDVIVLGAFAFQTFMPFVELLAEKYHVYGVVMRMDGKSEEKNADGTTNWSRQWGSDIYNFVRELNLPKFHYVGKCHGSVPGWYLAKNHSECLKSFCSYFMAPHTKKQTSNKFFEVLQAKGVIGMLEASLRKPEGIKTKLDEMKSAGKVDVSIVPRYAVDFTANIWNSTTECIETLKNMSVPVEYLFGSDDLYFQDHFDSNIYAMMNTKGTRSVILEGERHFIEIDSPERLVNEISIFIEESARKY